MIYRPMKSEEAERVNSLVMRCFEEFIAGDCTQEGRAEFVGDTSADAFRLRLGSTSDAIVAEDQGVIIALVEITYAGHIKQLFVAKEYHGRKIASALVQKACEICCTRTPELREITVRSSLYGVPFYRKYGFKETGPRQEFHGIPFVPLTLSLG